ncbi:charged multivesicular body protein 1b-like [Choloepus didactylus]|uniref:charged multivesicular body protein 1b-like n=1 Tax=Choloepus didactylus TaxID=27675 RepID=UPI0018A090E7|nr:charged multivesicular body protein 1b-like [Choloepus didactylus]
MSYLQNYRCSQKDCAISVSGGRGARGLHSGGVISDGYGIKTTDLEEVGPKQRSGTRRLRMSARVDAVDARVQTAVTMSKVTKSMAGVVKLMDTTLKIMNLEKISAVMDKFEHQFETLDMQTQQMEDKMSSTTLLTTPQGQVDMLLQEMADEAGLDLNMELPQGHQHGLGQQDELSQGPAHLQDQV